MRPRSVYSMLLSGAVGLTTTGCASSSRHTARPEPRPLGAQYVSAGLEADASAEARTTVTEEPTGALHMDQALALALLHNPELEAFSHDVRAAEAKTLQARLLPNPQIELEVEEFDRGGEGFDSAETAIVLQQLFELGGKRRRRARVAEARGDLAGWDYEGKRLDVFTATAQRFMAVVAAQSRVDLARSAAELAEQTLQAVTERVKAGREPPLQATKAAAELEMTRIAVLKAEAEIDAARQKLAAAWGSEKPSFEVAQGQLDIVLDSIPPLERLRALLTENPAVARWDAELTLLKAELSVQRAARIPDVQASVGLQNYEEDGTSALAFRAGLPLPLFNRNQGNVRAAKHELAKAEAQRRSAEAELAAELVEAHAELASAHRTAVALKSQVVPAMAKAFSSAHEGYKQGKFGFLDMLDAQRGLFKAKGSLLDALYAYNVALTRIERITGTRMAEISTTKQEESQ